MCGMYEATHQYGVQKAGELSEVCRRLQIQARACCPAAHMSLHVTIPCFTSVLSIYEHWCLSGSTRVGHSDLCTVKSWYTR